MTVERAASVIADRVIPAMIVATVVSLAATSRVGFNVWVLDGPWGNYLAFGYAAALVTAMLHNTRRGHAIAGSFGAFVFGGRVAGFVEFAIVNDRPLLGDDGLSGAIVAAFTSNPGTGFLGNIIERALLAAFIIVFHGYQLTGIAEPKRAGNTQQDGTKDER